MAEPTREEVTDDRPSFRESPTFQTALRCAAVVEEWKEKDIDMERDWDALLHSFAWALGMRVQIGLELKPDSEGEG